MSNKSITADLTATGSEPRRPSRAATRVIRRIAGTSVAVVPTIGILGPTAPTASAQESSDPGSVGVANSGQDLIIEETLAADGTVIETTTYDAFGNVVTDDTTATGVYALLDSGSGGTSTASGCKRVTVSNEEETVLGFTAFRYNTWTEWCWNRSRRSVSDVSTGQYFSDVDPNFIYREIVNKEERFYAWQSGYNKSGHKHFRQAHWENCVLKYGCIGSLYPSNWLYAHSDGTWYWKTDG